MLGRLVDKQVVEDLIWMDKEGAVVIDPVGPGKLLDIMPWLRFLGNKTYVRLMKVVNFSKEWLLREFKFNKVFFTN